MCVVYLTAVIDRPSFYFLSVPTFVLLITLCFLDPGKIAKKPGAPLLVPFTQTLYKSAPTQSVCPYCSIIRPPRAQHCWACNRCVHKYDHHCPWIRNCVGARTIGIFYVFIVFMLSSLVFSLCDLSMRLDACLRQEHRQDSDIFLVVIGLGVSIVVGLSDGKLVLVSTRNLMLGRTSHERFSASKQGGDTAPGSLLTNCLQMCCDRAPLTPSKSLVV